MSESANDQKNLTYNTPCYQLTRQFLMLIMMMITMVLSLLMEGFQMALNDKVDEAIKCNCTKT